MAFCTLCGAPVEMASVGSGQALISDGKLTCRACVEKIRQLHSQRKLLKGVSALALAAFVLGAVFAPGQVLLLGGIIAGIGAIAGALGTHFGKRMRLLLTGGGAALAVASFAGASHFAHVNSQRTSVESIRAQSDMVEQLVGNQRGLDAMHVLTSLRNKVKSDPELNGNPEAQRILDGLQARIDEWFCATYGKRSRDEQHVLVQLFMCFGEKTASGARRFPALQLQNDQLQITVTTSAAQTQSGPPGAGHTAEREASRFASFVFENFPGVNKLTVTLEIEGASTVLKECTFSRSEFSVPAAASGPMQRPNGPELQPSMAPEAQR